MRYAAYAGIAYLLLTVPSTVLGVARDFVEFTAYMNIAYIVLTVLTALAGMVMLWGFKVLGFKTQNRLLEIAAICGIIVELLGVAYEITYTLIREASAINELIIPAILLLLFGAYTLTLGIAILKLKEKFGKLATAAGILNIAGGALTLTLILALLGVLLWLPAQILEVIILYKASKEP